MFDKNIGIGIIISLQKYRKLIKQVHLFGKE